MKYSQYSFVDQKKPETASCRCTPETADSLTDKLNLCDIERDKRQDFSKESAIAWEKCLITSRLCSQVTRDAENDTSSLNYGDNLRGNLQKYTLRYTAKLPALIFVISRNSDFPRDSNSNVNLSYLIKRRLYFFLYYSRWNLCLKRIISTS